MQISVNESMPDELFYKGKSAMTFTVYWVLQVLEYFPEIKKHAYLAQMPRPSYVGGLNLLIWKHTKYRREAVKLLQFLSGSEANLEFLPNFGMPSRLTALQHPPFSTETTYLKIVDIIKSGRVLSSQHLWGMIENRLTDIVPILWKEIFANPDKDLDTILDKYLPALVRCLQGALSVLK